MKEDTGIAIVTKVLKRPVVRLTGGLEVSGFTARARMYAPAHKYSDDLFYVKVISPAAMGSRQPDQGTLMDHGEFEVDVPEEVRVGDKLKVSISPARSAKEFPEQ
jgi:hypothetical protein